MVWQRRAGNFCNYVLHLIVHRLNLSLYSELWLGRTHQCFCTYDQGINIQFMSEEDFHTLITFRLSLITVRVLCLIAAYTIFHLLHPLYSYTALFISSATALNFLLKMFFIYIEFTQQNYEYWVLHFAPFFLYFVKFLFYYFCIVCINVCLYCFSQLHSTETFSPLLNWFLFFFRSCFECHL